MPEAVQRHQQPEATHMVDADERDAGGESAPAGAQPGTR